MGRLAVAAGKVYGQRGPQKIFMACSESELSKGRDLQLRLMNLGFCRAAGGALAIAKQKTSEAGLADARKKAAVVGRLWAAAVFVGLFGIDFDRGRWRLRLGWCLRSDRN